MIRVYYHPRNQLDMDRVKREFPTETVVTTKGTLHGVLLDNEMEPPFKRAGFASGLWVSSDYGFDGFVEIQCDERHIAPYEIDGENGRRRWCVPSDLLNRNLHEAKILAGT